MENQKVKKTSSLFGRFSSEYDRHMEETNHIKAQVEVLSKLKPLIRGKVCDLACGTGRVSKISLDFNRCEAITLIDFQDQMLEIAKRNLSDRQNVQFLLMDVHNLDQLNEQFDTLICSFGFYWFEHPSRVISGIKKVLRQNGVVILLEEHFYEKDDSQPAFARQGGYLAELAALEDYLGIATLISLFKKEGFRLKKRSHVGIDRIHELHGLAFVQ